MGRLARLVFSGYPHHVSQRGNYDQIVFDNDEDYVFYLKWLQKYSRGYGIDVLAYCLMPNHVHLVCIPKNQKSLARSMNALHMRYAQYFNKKKAVRGHLWRSRFLACVLDQESLYEEIRFIENNPVRKSLVEQAEDYRWSSARGHLSGGDDSIICYDNRLSASIEDWRNYLHGSVDQVVLSRVRARLKSGRPAGSPQFIAELENQIGIRLEARPRGRPRRIAADIPCSPGFKNRKKGIPHNE